jgi:hypothetical protein
MVLSPGSDVMKILKVLLRVSDQESFLLSLDMSFGFTGRQVEMLSMERSLCFLRQLSQSELSSLLTQTFANYCCYELKFVGQS